MGFLPPCLFSTLIDKFAKLKPAVDYHVREDTRSNRTPTHTCGGTRTTRRNRFIRAMIMRLEEDKKKMAAFTPEEGQVRKAQRFVITNAVSRCDCESGSLSPEEFCAAPSRRIRFHGPGVAWP